MDNVEELPDRLVDCFLKLSNGLLSSFALAAVAAVRKNMHHIITKFSQELDAAYVANRLITDPPEDVAELIKDLFISECDAALSIENVKSNYLEPTQITKWLDAHGQPIRNDLKYKSKKTEIFVKRKFIDNLLNEGFKDDQVMIEDGSLRKFPEQNRNLVSCSFHDCKESAIEAESQFSRFVLMRHELYGNSKVKSDKGWTPSLNVIGQ